MCVLALAWRADPDHPLVLIGNRDERHDRASAPLGWWPDRPDLLGGRDLVSGGSWLAVSGSGRLAVVTNRYGFGPPDPMRRSRGGLVTDWLERGVIAEGGADAYNAFNLIVVSPRGARFATNRPEAREASLAPGLHTLSNDSLDTPWPKSEQLRAALSAWIAARETAVEPLFAALADRGVASDAPEGPAGSPVFILNPVYGTRCSTVVMVDRQGQGRIWERRFDAEGKAIGDSDFAFAWPEFARADSSG